jgi:hypothetical protein
VSSLQRPRHPGQSLPDLRSDFELDSGDSTDSLIDEAEEYLRRSIDSMLTGTDWGRVGRRRQNRRFSEPDPVRGMSWQCDFNISVGSLAIFHYKCFEVDLSFHAS